MIPLHVNWSAALRELLLDRRLEVDGIKIPDWPQCLLPAMDVVRILNAASAPRLPARPVGVQVHFAYATTDGLVSDHELTQSRGFLDTTATEIVNTHFHMPRDIGRLQSMDEDRLMSVAFAHVRQLADRFGPGAVVVEHIPESGPLATLGSYPALLCRLVRETGVGLLLDISHARLSARHHGCSTEDYVNRLPLDRLKLIHSTGIGQDSDGAWVDHLPMDDDDYAVLSWLLRGARAGRFPMPCAVQHEYGGISGFLGQHSSADVLEREVRALGELLSEA